MLLGMRPLRTWLLLGLALSLAALGAVLVNRVLAQPDAALSSPPAGPVAGGVPHVLAEVVMRGSGVSSRTDPIELTAAELNGFLARHIEARRLPFRPVMVEARDGRLELAGRTSLGQLAGSGTWTGRMIARLPPSVRALDLWVSAEGRLEVKPGEAEFSVDRTALGRQPVPAGWLWGLLQIDPREQLSWRLPRIVERIEVKPGRLVVHTRRPPR